MQGMHADDLVGMHLLFGRKLNGGLARICSCGLARKRQNLENSRLGRPIKYFVSPGSDLVKKRHFLCPRAIEFDHCSDMIAVLSSRILLLGFIPLV